MHYTSITTLFQSVTRFFLQTLLIILATVIFTTSLHAGSTPNYNETRQDTYIGTDDATAIIIKEEIPSGDKIMKVKNEKQTEDCNKYTNGQYPIIIELKPDISGYTK